MVIPLVTTHAALLGRTFLYTAFTRARQLVVIVGQRKALSLAVRDWRRAPRYTALGYRTFRCGACRRLCNERTGTPDNHLQDPTDLVLLIVLWRLCDTLSLRNVAEMFLAWGSTYSREAAREWGARCTPPLTARLRPKRRG